MPIFEPARFQDTGYSIIHFGYLKEVISKKDKSQRNMDLLLKEAEENPTSFNRFNIGTEYMVIGDLPNAVKYFEESWAELKEAGALKRVGFTNFLILRLTRCTRVLGQFDKARDYALQGLELFPRSNDLLLEQAAMELSEGNLDEAARLAEKAIANGENLGTDSEELELKGGTLGKGSFLARLFLGDVRERQGNPSEAIQVYQTSLQEDPQYLGVISNLTRALLMSGCSPEETMQQLSPYTEGNLGSAGLMAAHSFYERGHAKQAQELYQRVLQKDPDDPIARIGMVECYLSQGEIEKASDLCQNIPESNPLADSLLRSGIFCALLRDDDLAAGDLMSQAEELRLPGSDRSMFQIWLDARKGKEVMFVPEQAGIAALPMLEAALKLQKLETAEQLIMLIRASNMTVEERSKAMGEIFTKQGFLDSAAEAWLEWIDASGPQPESLIGLAYIAHAEGSSEQALALAQDALSLDPANQEAARMVAAFAA